MANELQLEHERLTNQARFIQMIVKKELVVSGRKKADIVTELRKKNFRPFPKVAKAKAAGETEEAIEDIEAEEMETGATTDFDYLLGMPIYSLTTEKIEKLLEQGRQKETELLALLEKTPAELWNTDLDIFLEQWKVSYFPLINACHNLSGSVAIMQRVGGVGHQGLDWQDRETQAGDAEDAEVSHGTLWKEEAERR